MAKAMRKIGDIACQCCGERVPLAEQANGLAMYNCQWCGFKAQAYDGAASDKLKSRARLNTPPPESPAPPKPEPAPAAPPPKSEAKRKPFGLLIE